jgi:hypothetical protein
VRTAIAGAERSAFDLRLVAHTAFNGVDYRDRDTLARHHGFEAREALTEGLDKMSLPEITLFVIDCALVRKVQVDYYDLKSQPETLLAAAAHYGVDVEQVRRAQAAA